MCFWKSGAKVIIFLHLLSSFLKKSTSLLHYLVSKYASSFGYSVHRNTTISIIMLIYSNNWPLQEQYYKIFPIFALTKPTDLCIQRQNQKMKRWQPTRKRLNRVWRSLCHLFGTLKNISATPTRCRAILVISRHTLGETDTCPHCTWQKKRRCWRAKFIPLLTRSW